MNDCEQAICFLCHQILKNPLKTTCQHVFCQKCILKWLTENLMCPCNCGILFTNELVRALDLTIISENLHFRCPNYRNGCPVILMKKEFKNHLKNECKFPRNISMNSQTPTSKNNGEKMEFFNGFLDNFFEKLQINNFIQPQIDLINEILTIVGFIENLKMCQIKMLDITTEINQKDGKSSFHDFSEIKETLNKMDLKPLNSHILLIAEKIKVYMKNAKHKPLKIKNEKAQSSKLLPNKPPLFLESQNIKLDSKPDTGFLTSQRNTGGFFSKTMKIHGERPPTTTNMTKKSIDNKNQALKQINPINITSQKRNFKNEKNEESIESIEKARKRLMLQQNRLLKITHTHGVLNDSLTPESNLQNIEGKSINSAGKYYMINNITTNKEKMQPSKRNHSSVKIQKNNSIRKTQIDLTTKKLQNQGSPCIFSQKSKKSLKTLERNSNRFQRSNCSIKNTTSSSSGSKKVLLEI